MNTLRRSAIAAALATVFAGPAAAGSNATAPEQPSRACDSYLKTGADAQDCARSLRHWADVYAGEQEDYIVNEQKNKPLPSIRELTYLGDIRASCETVRGQTDAATLTDTVLAADQCLRRAYEYGQIGKTNTAGIVNVGETLQQVGRALQARALPSPKQACAEYLSSGKGGKECAQSIAQATSQTIADLAKHAGPQADALVKSCQMLETAADRMPVGYIASMALKCLDEASRVAQASGYKNTPDIEALQAVAGDVALAGIGKPQPRDLPKVQAP